MILYTSPSQYVVRIELYKQNFCTFLDSLYLVHLHLIYHSQDFELIIIDNNYPCEFDGTTVALCRRIVDEIDNCIVYNRIQ